MKYRPIGERLQRLRRAPHGARGLKLVCRYGLCGNGRSRPARGAWIEMFLLMS